MIYKNAELYNAEGIIHNDDGSISWKRVPDKVYDSLETDDGRRLARAATGVEMRFVMKSDKVVIRMSCSTGDGRFHVFRGGVQGGNTDHEIHTYVSGAPEDYEINIADIEKLKIVTEKSGYDWDPSVVRVIFDMGYFKIHDITGDIEPPRREQCPARTLFSYGSSITHGSNALDMSHSWVAVLAHNLNMDARNLGMAGNCRLEPEFAEYIASEGEKGNWDAATLELGVNVLGWEEEKIKSRVSNIINQVAGRNPEKPVVVISPFYYCDEDFEGNTDGNKWRRMIEQTAAELNYPNVKYVNGLDIIDNMSYMSGDFIHPNIYGAARIASKLTDILKAML